MSIEKMAAKVKELKDKGQGNREISQEMNLSQATVEWLLAKQASEKFDEALPPDVKVGWRTIGVSARVRCSPRFRQPLTISRATRLQIFPRLWEV